MAAACQHTVDLSTRLTSPLSPAYAGHVSSHSLVIKPYIPVPESSTTIYHHSAARTGGWLRLVVIVKGSLSSEIGLWVALGRTGASTGSERVVQPWKEEFVSQPGPGDSDSAIQVASGRSAQAAALQQKFFGGLGGVSVSYTGRHGNTVHCSMHAHCLA